ncbi:MAG TPA: cytochrome C oxidase subunit IV family protein [Thermodesulfovibrionales bacterium]|jgi:cytochrome c oxidase subunit 4|nr:cytochrome C oxidase subunit IV family protein [Thermodesulfovibrionales bacterium]
MSTEQETQLTATRYRKYVYVWLSLIVLTSLTVSVARLHLTSYAILIAILIATTKAGIVVTFFMHLKNEPLILRLMLFVALLAFTLIALLTFSDVWYR